MTDGRRPFTPRLAATSVWVPKTLSACRVLGRPRTSAPGNGRVSRGVQIHQAEGAYMVWSGSSTDAGDGAPRCPKDHPETSDSRARQCIPPGGRGLTPEANTRARSGGCRWCGPPERARGGSARTTLCVPRTPSRYASCMSSCMRPRRYDPAIMASSRSIRFGRTRPPIGSLGVVAGPRFRPVAAGLPYTPG